jgi:hypothetical protein
MAKVVTAGNVHIENTQPLSFNDPELTHFVILFLMTNRHPYWVNKN